MPSASPSWPTARGALPFIVVRAEHSLSHHAILPIPMIRNAVSAVSVYAGDAAVVIGADGTPRRSDGTRFRNRQPFRENPVAPADPAVEPIAAHRGGINKTPRRS